MPAETAAGDPAARHAALADRRVRRLLAGLAILFLAAVALQLHGSSIAVWKLALHDEASPSGLLYSSPKGVRSDEWLAWTPSLFSQALQKPPFPLENANVGAGKSPMLLNLPVRHFSMLFRPQLYGFFVFDLETAFSFYWNVKTFGLFLAFFLLLYALTQGNFWLSIFGSGWVCLSAYIQWWFSCPPMMPEMLASWAVAIFCTIRLFEPQARLAWSVMLLVLVVAGVNFVLCFYPPFQIPLCYLGLALVGGWLWQQRDSALPWRAGLIALGLGAAGVLAVVIPYLLECLPTLELVSQTKYPGGRRSSGGDLPFIETLNGVWGFFNTSELVYLATKGNSCEGSNFYPLWLLALATGGGALWQQRRERPLEIALVVCLAVFTLYTFCPVPPWLARATLLSYVTGTRMLLSAGIAGILLTTMLMAKPVPLRPRSKRVVFLLAALAGVMALFAVAYHGNEQYFTVTRALLLLGLNALFVSLYFLAPQRIFCGVFLTALLVNNGGVNPLATGLGPLLDATPSPVIRGIVQRDPGGKWVVYGAVGVAQFIRAQGADVLNGLQIVPDLAFCREVDPAGQYEEIYNRYSFMNLSLGEGKRVFRTMSVVVYGLDISPVDPLLLRRGVRYAIFRDALVEPEQSGIRLIASLPTHEMWIYRLPAQSAEEIRPRRHGPALPK
jgi:hypothetical protein